MLIKTHWYDTPMKPQIYFEVREFLELHKMPAARLARQAGILPVTLTRVLSGERKDMVSASADALRDAMRSLTATPTTPPAGVSGEGGDDAA